MTRLGIAVNRQCGEFKDGAFAACPKCGYNPTELRAWAKQSLASDRYHNREELETLAARVKAGGPVEFDPAAVHAGFMREEVKRLTAEHGTAPPPWAVYREHPYSICWRMGGGETHKLLWWEWWQRQAFTADQKIASFRRWPPPHCWLAFLIEAIWDVDRREGDERLLPYFERTAALGFGGYEGYERDLGDPKWLGR